MSRLIGSIAIIALAAGCQSFDRLREDDRTVGEDEIHRAGAEADEADLRDHLVHILERRAQYRADQVVAAIAALAARGDVRAVPEIAALGTDPDEEVRYHVAVALGRLGGPEADAARRRLAADERSALVRRALDAPPGMAP